MILNDTTIHPMSSMGNHVLSDNMTVLSRFSRSLTLYNVLEEDGGRYTCRASGIDGITEKTLELIVQS